MAEYMKPAINLNGDESFKVNPEGRSSYGLCVQHSGGIVGDLRGSRRIRG